MPAGTLSRPLLTKRLISSRQTLTSAPTTLLITTAEIPKLCLCAALINNRFSNQGRAGKTLSLQGKNLLRLRSLQDHVFNGGNAIQTDIPYGTRISGCFRDQPNVPHS
ncbi:hypothetical protein Bbelb_108800 [Branchiostoma belcheri]|nr:hypothetical protein Bbelb_108800 [Branchiostoma belcheri]